MDRSKTERRGFREPAIEDLAGLSVPTAQIAGEGPGSIRCRSRRRGVALLLLVLSVSLLLVATGLTFISIQRADRRLQQNLAQTGELEWYARAGIEMALACTEQASNWRSLAAGNGGKLFTDVAVGDGKVTVQLFDEVDGQVANSDADPVRILSTARRDTATCTLEVRLQPRPHPALKYVCFGTGAGTMELKGTATVQGPVRSHGPINSAGGVHVQDDASFETMSGYSIQDPLSPKSYAATAIPAPQPDLSVYQSMATIISGSGGSRCDLKGCNLTPTVNSTGPAVNPKGIYWLQGGGREVYIENLHVGGTLIISDTGGNKISFQKGLWLEPGPMQYPVLLADCPLNIVEIKPDSTLSEVTLATLLSPTFADVNGDGDALDVLPTQVRGLIWTNCTQLYLRNSTWNFMGCAINGRITVDNNVVVDNDMTLQDALCPGFAAGGMSLVAGSIREVWP